MTQVLVVAEAMVVPATVPPTQQYSDPIQLGVYNAATAQVLVTADKTNKCTVSFVGANAIDGNYQAIGTPLVINLTDSAVAVLSLGLTPWAFVRLTFEAEAKVCVCRARVSLYKA